VGPTAAPTTGDGEPPPPPLPFLVEKSASSLSDGGRGGWIWVQSWQGSTGENLFH